MQRNYPTIDVDFSLKRYLNNCAEKNKPVSKSGYEIWLETDYREGWNLNEDDVKKEDEVMYDYDPPSYK